MRIAVVTPVYNDWDCLAILLGELDRQFASGEHEVSVLAVNDASDQPVPGSILARRRWPHLKSVQVLDLVRNVGHQRAIALGLTEVALGEACDLAIVMDGDGEDRPEDIPRLIEAHHEHPDHLVVAQRAKRTETLLFRAFYAVYRVLFWLMTGKRISFGNFSLIPGRCLRRLITMTETWNNIPAGMLRSRVGVIRVPTCRGHRYSGRSRMNFTALVLHGLSAIAVFSDIVFVRLLLACAVMGSAAVGMLVAVALIRTLTDLAIPGWASYVALASMILLMEAVLVAIVAAVFTLNARSASATTPLQEHALLAERRSGKPLTPHFRAALERERFEPAGELRP